MEIVAIQGVKGSYSEQAAEELFEGYAEIVECMSFDETYAKVLGGVAKYAVVPVSNIIVGEIAASVKLLKESRLSVIRQLDIKIEHVLAGTEDAEFDDVATVRSHIEALKQCRKFLDSNPQIEQQGGADTALSIRDVVSRGDRRHAAIGSKRAAHIYGAKILREAIADHIDNWTTFYLIGN